MTGLKAIMTLCLVAGLSQIARAEHDSYAPNDEKDAPKKVNIAIYAGSGPCEYEYSERGEIKIKKQTVSLKPKYFCGPGSEKACTKYKDDRDARNADAEAQCRFEAKADGGTVLKASIDSARCSYSEADYCPAD